MNFTHKPLHFLHSQNHTRTLLELAVDRGLPGAIHLGANDCYMISVKSPADFTPSDAEGNTRASKPKGWGSLALASMPAN